MDLLRTPNIRKYTLIFWYTFLIQIFIYYGISYNIGSYGGNYFVNFMLAGKRSNLYIKLYKFSLIGFVELPSHITCIIGFKFFGRKKLSIFFLLLLFISSLLMIPTSIRLYVALLGKFAISSSWWCSHLLRRELFPTVLRTTADGTIAIMSRIGAIAAPFVKQAVIKYISIILINSTNFIHFQGRLNWTRIHIHILCFIIINQLWINIFIS